MAFPLLHVGDVGGAIAALRLIDDKKFTPTSPSPPKRMPDAAPSACERYIASAVRPGQYNSIC
jgi:hypothetical protein